MPFNINRFQGEMDRGGISRTDHFEVIITPPKNVINLLRDRTADNLEIQSGVDSFAELAGGRKQLEVAESIMLRARSVNLPGRSVAQTEFFEHGSEYKIASASNYQNVSMGIICSDNLIEREFFLQWQDLAIGRHRVDGSLNRNGFYGSYYSDYISTIDINIYNEVGLNTRTVQLIEAFPVSVLDIQYDWGTSEHAIIPIDISYRYFYERRTDFAKPRSVPKKSGGKPNGEDVITSDPKNSPKITPTVNPDTQTVPDMKELDAGLNVEREPLAPKPTIQQFYEQVERFQRASPTLSDAQKLTNIFKRLQNNSDSTT